MKRWKRQLDAKTIDSLRLWAMQEPSVQVLAVFGSYARGDADSESDLDVALEFVSEIDDPLVHLIINRARWRKELTDATKIQVRDIYPLADDIVQSGPLTEVYYRRSLS